MWAWFGAGGRLGKWLGRRPGRHRKDRVGRVDRVARGGRGGRVGPVGRVGGRRHLGTGTGTSTGTGTGTGNAQPLTAPRPPVAYRAEATARYPTASSSHARGWVYLRAHGAPRAGPWPRRLDCPYRGLPSGAVRPGGSVTLGAASALLTPGFWCERFVYRSVHADRLASWSALATRSPVRAVRLMGADAQEVAAGLPGDERQRVLGELGRPGQVGAVAALLRGEPCGLALNCGGAWVEWSASSVLFLPLVDGAAPGTPCPCRGGKAVGFGARLTPTGGLA